MTMECEFESRAASVRFGVEASLRAGRRASVISRQRMTWRVYELAIVILEPADCVGQTLFCPCNSTP